MYTVETIRQVHLEISSLCNAECPMCPRNLHGYPFNEGYQEHNMTLVEAQQVFPLEFLQQLTQLLINGNLGDMIMNPETVDIVRYFRQSNPGLHIEINTNGSARNSAFWTALAELNVIINFAIDGLEDTHSLYRRNTVYATIMRNAATFIQAGGRARWRMIEFAHNLHQREQARELSRQLGFWDFQLAGDGRDSGPVYDRTGQLAYTIGSVEQPLERIDSIVNNRSAGVLELEYVTTEIKPRIACLAIKTQSVYINSIGELYPCCYLGCNPGTYGLGSYMGAANSQVRELMQKNSLLEYDIATAIEWFNRVEESWQKPTIAEGRLIHCNDVCGRN